MPNDASAQRLAAIVLAAQDAIFEVARDGRITLWNPAAERLFGYTADEAVGLPVSVLVPADRAGEATFAPTAATSGTAPPSFETVRLRKDGTPVPVSVVVSPIHDAGGTPRSAAVAVRDLRPLAETRAALAASEARFRALVERAGEMYLICTADGVITYVSPRDATPGGRRPEDLIGKSAFAMVHDDDRAFVRSALAAFAARPGPHEPIVVRGFDAVGGTLWYRLTPTNLLDDPAVDGIVLVAEDVTDLTTARDELALYARRDHLTGLPTRAALPDLLATLRTTHPGRTALVVVDVEELRAVRREAGHLAADTARRAVAERLCSAMAPGDVVARLGPDTFGVLRGGVPDADAARRLGEDVLGVVGEPTEVHGRVWTLGATAGVAASATAGANELVRDADLARYEAKARGIAGVEVFAPALKRRLDQRLELTRTLRQGVSPDSLVVEFQPAVRLADGVVVGAEALVRWRAPDGVLVQPDAFLPAATASGLLPFVGEWMLRNACAAAAGWDGAARPYVAVNLSARELESEWLVGAVRAAVADAGLAPERLVLEVAESAVPARRDGVAATLAELASLGVRIAFDGGGAASFVYLKRLPVSMMKIGREFVAGLGRDDDDDAIVAGLLNLSAAIGIDAVAVGVENDDQRALLAQLGCPVAQGFLLGVPAARPSWADVPAATSGRVRRAARPAPALDPVVVARIRSLMRDGASLYTISAALNAERLSHPEERRWHPRAVAHAIATAPELTSPRARWSVL
ncbi:MAG TPA: EAL domain-containing protein [Mycobacteriales bacterium]|jgi:PAS domain S-box-containing protein/diguanylate cyclase (GGDEF)-like protein